MQKHATWCRTARSDQRVMAPVFKHERIQCESGGYMERTVYRATNVEGIPWGQRALDEGPFRSKKMRRKQPLGNPQARQKAGRPARKEPPFSRLGLGGKKSRIAKNIVVLEKSNRSSEVFFQISKAKRGLKP